MAALSYGKRLLKTSLKVSESFKRTKRISPDEEAEYYCKSVIDKDGFQLKYISDYKGYGVIAQKQFKAGEFLLQYCGEKLSAEDGVSRLKKSHSESKIFFYNYGGKELCIDAEESMGHLCQMVNDAPDKVANSVMKLKVFGNTEYLCLYTLKDIQPGEEIVYNYGDEKNLWWRKKDYEKRDQFEFESDSDPFELNSTEEEDYVSDSEGEEVVREEDSNLSTVSAVYGSALNHQFVAEPWYLPQSTCSKGAQENGEVAEPGNGADLEIDRDGDLRIGEAANEGETDDEPEREEVAVLDANQRMVKVDLQSRPKSRKGAQENGEVAEPGNGADLEIDRDGDLRIGEAANEGETDDEPEREEVAVLDANQRMVKVDLQSRPKSRKGAQENGEVAEPGNGADLEIDRDGDLRIGEAANEGETDDEPEREEVAVLDANQRMVKVDLQSRPKSRKGAQENGEVAEPGNGADLEIDRDGDLRIGEAANEGETDDEPEREEVAVLDANQRMVKVDLQSRPKSRKGAQENGEVAEPGNGADLEIDRDGDLRIGEAANEGETDDEPEREEVAVLDANQRMVKVDLQSRPKSRKKPDRYCKFCDEIVKGGKLKRHILRKHKVCLQDTLPTTSEKRVFDQLRKEGIHKYNTKLMANNKDPTMRERMPKKEDSLRLCSDCNGYFSNKYFFRHKCVVKKPTSLKPKLSLSATMKQIKGDQQFIDILNRFQADFIGDLCRTDEVIIIVGYRHFNLRRHEEGKEDEVRKVVMSEMRTLARLYAEFEGKCNGKSVEDMLSRPYLEDLCAAIRTLTSGEKCDKHGLRQSVDAVILRSIKTLKGHYSSTQQDAKSKELKHFLEGYRHKSKELIPKARQTSIKNSFEKARKPINLPPEKNLRKLKEFIELEIDQITKDFDIAKYAYLRTLVVARLTLFNARRGEEASRLLLEEWNDALNGTWLPEQEIEKTKDIAVKYLLGQFKLAYLKGKGKDFVDVLIPNDTIRAISILVEERSSFGIAKENHFLFGTKERAGNRNSHCSGWHAVSEACSKAGVTGGITATKMRHRASTFYASLDMSEKDQKIFLEHMGHGKDINKDNYQCPQGIRTVAVMGEVLTNMDEGADPSRSRKSLCSGSTTQLDVASSEGPVTSRKFSPKLCSSSTTQLDIPTSEDDDNDDNDASKKFRKLSRAACSRLELVTQTSEDEQKEDDSDASSVVLSKKLKQQVKWSESDTALLRRHFSHCIYSNAKDNKGNLPTKKQILEFIYENKLISLENLPEQEQYLKVRTKLFNERKTCRATLKNKLKSVMCSPKNKS